ncbi:MAG: hypothetical protein IT470_09250 [Pseudomonadales bacterium]|nr:hypothetical protein [Pseudomonadales bacterium]
MQINIIKLIIVFFLLIGSSSSFSGEEVVFQPSERNKHNYIPKDGVIPNDSTAIKIAIAILEPIYGVDKIASEVPFSAVLSNGVWVVKGSAKKGVEGGYAVVEMSQVDGRIYRISHGK